MCNKTYRDITDIAATAKATLKAEFPKCKFSVRIERYSGGQSLSIHLMEAPFEVFAPESEQMYPGRVANTSLNEYSFRDHPDGTNLGWASSGNALPDYTNNGVVLTKEGYDLCRRMCEIGLVEHWDKSDPQTDYFNCAYYFHAGIGKWNKPFAVVVKGGK